MTSNPDNFREALRSKQLGLLTRALSEIAQSLECNLKPPYTEMTQLRAEEDVPGYAIQFSATLYLHYAAMLERNEGLVFSVRFGAHAHADSPSPPIQELFSAASVDELVVYGYGHDWAGQVIPTPELFAKNLEVPSPTLTLIPTETFLSEIAR